MPAPNSFISAIPLHRIFVEIEFIHTENLTWNKRIKIEKKPRMSNFLRADTSGSLINFQHLVQIYITPKEISSHLKLLNCMHLMTVHLSWDQLQHSPGPGFIHNG